MNSRTGRDSSKVDKFPFNKFQSNIYSQNGEDGVIAEILRRIEVDSTSDRWCVEFGAWDGKHLSNTFALVEREHYGAIYIEGHKERFEDLIKTVSKHPKIVPICAYVSPLQGDDASLDNLLLKTDLPKNFELLSIDIDSCDLDVWESFIHYEPKIVVIEINSSVPPGVIWRHGPKTPQNTFSATINVAKDKGYELVCHTGNLIFVRRDLIKKLSLDERFIKYPELLFLFDSKWFPDGMFSSSSRALFKRLAVKLTPKPLRLLFEAKK